MWGTAVGLRLARLFAHQPGAPLAAGRRLSRHERGASPAGTSPRAAVATAPLSSPIRPTRWASRASSSPARPAVGLRRRNPAAARDAGRALLEAVAVTVIALAVALVKNLLAGH